MADKKMVEYYNSRAPEYEQIYFRDNLPRREEIDVEAANLKKLVSGKAVLELACGTGYWTQLMSETAKSITATDIAAEMIKEARKKNYTNPVEFIQADMNHLPFEPKRFDLVALGFWFSHEPKQNYDQFSKLLLNLIKPNGQIWMIDNNPPAEGPKTDSTGVDEFGNNYKNRYLDNGEEHVILKNYFDKEQLTTCLEKYFKIKQLVHNKYYWSAVVGGKPQPDS